VPLVDEVVVGDVVVVVVGDDVVDDVVVDEVEEVVVDEDDVVDDVVVVDDVDGLALDATVTLEGSVIATVFVSALFTRFDSVAVPMAAAVTLYVPTCSGATNVVAIVTAPPGLRLPSDCLAIIDAVPAPEIVTNTPTVSAVPLPLLVIVTWSGAVVPAPILLPTERDVTAMSAFDDIACAAIGSMQSVATTAMTLRSDTGIVLSSRLFFPEEAAPPSSSVARLSDLGLTRGFAPRPHDRFALLGKSVIGSAVYIGAAMTQ